MIVIFNPVAGRRRAQALWQVLDILVANGMRVELAETQFPGHAEYLARDAAAGGAPLVVAAGGDGTVSEVANGLLGTEVNLGVIPIGTANVLAHELQLPFLPRRIAAALAFGRTRDIWPGMMHTDEHSRLFVQMLGIGFDGHVVRHLNPALKRLAGRSAYAMQALASSVRYSFPPIGLRLDAMETQAHSVIVSKGRFYGGRFRLAQGASQAKPGFVVTLFDWPGAAPVLMYGAGLAIGFLRHAPGIRQVHSDVITVTANTRIPVQTDGDAAGYTPLGIRNSEGPIRIVVG